MWRWPTIAAQKEKNAKMRAKINTLHARLITLASEKWSDPKENTSLSDAIHTAKKDGVTADVIERAIRRWAWLDKDSTKVEEILYEWYVSGGVAVIVRTLTDNRNRTASNIRHIFSAFWGSMSETGSVSRLVFDPCGIIVISHYDDAQTLEMAILETDALDYHIDWDEAILFTDRAKLSDVRKTLEKSGYNIQKANFEYRAKNFVEVTDMENILKIYKILEAFEEDEDVDTVWNNARISAALWQEATQKVESSRFRT